MVQNFTRFFTCFVVTKFMLLDYPTSISGSYISSDEKLTLFENCLVKWRISYTTLANVPLFLNIQTKILNKTPNILQTGIALNISQRISLNISNDIPQNTKYLKCTVLFNEIFPKQVVSNVLDGEPEFIIYISRYNIANFESNLGDHIANVNFSGTPLFFNSDGKLRLLCFSKLNLFVAIPPFVKNKTALKFYWKMLHRDLRGATLATITTTQNCSLRQSSFICLIQSFLNMTTKSISEIRIDLIDVLDNLIITPNIIQHVPSFRFSTLKYDFAIPGFKFKHYGLVIALVKPSQHNFIALTQPFDIYVWLTLICMLLFVSRVLRKINASSRTKNKVGCSAWVFLTLAAFCGQCNDTVKNVFKTDKCKFLWILWTSTSFVISSLYDGQSYSILSGEFEIRYPKTLKEISNQNLSVFTTGLLMTSFNSTHRRFESSLRDYINNLNNSNLSVVPSYFETLLKNLHLVGSEKKTLISGIDEIVKLTQNFQNQHFAILDEPIRVLGVAPSIEMSDNIKVVHKKSIENLVTYEALLIRRNFLFSRILHINWQSKESGISDYWDRKNYLDDQIALFRLQKLKNVKQTMNVVAYLQKFITNGLITSNHDLKDEPIALSFHLFLGIFIVYIVLMAFACVVFGFEKREAVVVAINRLTMYYKERKTAVRFIKVKCLHNKL